MLAEAIALILNGFARSMGIPAFSKASTVVFIQTL